ncbi:MAG TPA: cytochrome P450 [Herpetosiphonaceae bacterium]
MKHAHPPGPRERWLLGSSLEAARDTVRFVVDLARYGPVSSCTFAGQRVYMVNDPALIHEALVSNRQLLSKDPRDRFLLALFLGQGLLVNEGESHARQRKLMAPAFHLKRIQGYAATMVELTGQALDEWASGEIRDLDHEMMGLTLRIVAKTLFSAEVSQRDMAVIGSSLDQIQRDSIRLSILPFNPPRWMPVPPRRRILEASAALDSVVVPIINRRRQQPIDTGDVLSMLLLARDEDGAAMSDRQIRDEVMTLFLAGHETTANAMTWCLYLLSQHPAVAEQLRAQVDAALDGRPPTMADLERIPLCGQIIKETLRLYPSAWMMSARKVAADLRLGGYVIPKDHLFMISPYALHHDPAYWPDPERFDPGRFSPEREGEIVKHSYMPFGAGPRICIGNSFAMLEAQLILASIAQRFEWALDPEQRLGFDAQLTLGAKYGMRMRLTERAALSVHA